MNVLFGPLLTLNVVEQQSNIASVDPAHVWPALACSCELKMFSVVLPDVVLGQGGGKSLLNC